MIDHSNMIIRPLSMVLLLFMLVLGIAEGFIHKQVTSSTHNIPIISSSRSKKVFDGICRFHKNSQRNQYEKQQQLWQLYSSIASTAASAAESSSLPFQKQQQQQQQDQERQRREILLSRDGTYFDLNRSTNKIQFGKTIKLNIDLFDSADITVAIQEEEAKQHNNNNNHEIIKKQSNYDLVCAFLKSEEDIASAIWDKNKMTNLGNNVYRLQVMQLQFISIKLQPWVDVKMWTSQSSQSQQQQQQETPVFGLESINFEPNIKFLPGSSGSISAESLGLKVEVAGELKPTPNGTGLSGIITFQTTGKLPLPMRIIPSRALRAAARNLDNTIADFAVKSFQKGSVAQFNDFISKNIIIQKEERKQKTTTTNNENDNNIIEINNDDRSDKEVPIITTTSTTTTSNRRKKRYRILSFFKRKKENKITL